MKKRIGGVFIILLAFIMTLAMITPVGLVTSFELDAPWADGTTVKYTNFNGDNDGYKEIKDSSGSPSYPAFCMNRHFGLTILKIY